MIIHNTTKSELKTNHRRITNWAENPKDLLGWFDHFSLYLQEPCGIIKIDIIVEDDASELNIAKPYALFAIDEISIREEIKEGHITRFPKIQEQLEKADEVVSIGGKIKQYGDFMIKAERA